MTDRITRQDQLDASADWEPQIIQYKSFCALCSREVRVGDFALVAKAKNQDVDFKVHIECAANYQNFTSQEFKAETKRKTKTSGKKQAKKVYHTDNDPQPVVKFCSFCSLVVKGEYQTTGQNRTKRIHLACVDRAKDQETRTKNSLR